MPKSESTFLQFTQKYMSVCYPTLMMMMTTMMLQKLYYSIITLLTVITRLIIFFVNLFANVCVMSSTATYPEIIITYYYSCETGSATGSNILVIPPLVLLRFYLKTPFSVKVSSTTQLKIMYLFLYISTKNAAIFEKKTKQ